jgi:hypothetical protein
LANGRALSFHRDVEQTFLDVRHVLKGRNHPLWSNDRSNLQLARRMHRPHSGGLRLDANRGGSPGWWSCNPRDGTGETNMRSILLLVLGIPIPIIILIAVFTHC